MAENRIFDVVENKVFNTSLAHIVLKAETRLPTGELAVGYALASGEIDAFIEQLKTELDSAAIKAKAITQ